MGKVTKIVANVIAGIVLGIIGLLLGVMLLLDVGVVQDRLAGAASRFASDFCQTTVSVKAINITGYNRLSVREFYVEDHFGDTLLYVERAAARVSLAALIKGEVELTGVKADHAKLLLHDNGVDKINIAQITDLFTSTTNNEHPKPIILQNLQLTNSEFRFLNDERPPVPTAGMIDWGDMRFCNLNAKSDELIITGSHIEMSLRDVNFTDKTGARIDDINIHNFVIDHGLLEFDDCHIKMPHSDLNIPQIKLSSQSKWSQWKAFVDSVRMEIKLVKSVAGAQDLKYFVPFITKEQTFTLRDVTANFDGVTNNFGGRIDNVLVYGTRFDGRYHVADVVAKPLHFDGEITHLTTSAGDIEKLAEQFGIKELGKEEFAMLSRLGLIGLSAKADGRLDNFLVSSNIHTDLGTLTAQAQLGIGGGKLNLNNASASSDGFNAGYLTQVNGLGKVKFDASGDLTNYHADIAELNYNGYAYHNISATGSFDGELITANVVARDTAAMFTATGSYRMGAEPSYKATIDMERVDLHALNLNKRDTVSVISARITASGGGLTLDDLMATATIDKIKYLYSGGVYTTPMINLAATNTVSEHSFSLQSEPLTAEYISSADYSSSFRYLTDIIYVFLPALPADKEVAERKERDLESIPQNMTAPSHINVKCADINPLLRAIVPGLSIAKGTNIRLDYDPSERNVDISASSDYVEWRASAEQEPAYITRFVLKGWSKGLKDSLHLNLNSGAALFGGVRINQVQGNIEALNNHADVHLTASSDQMSMETNLNGVVELGRTDNGKLTVKGHISPSTLSIDGETWGLFSRQLEFLPDRIDIEELRATSKSGHFYIDGSLTSDNSDTLKLDITNIDLAPMAKLLKVDGLTVEGVLNGVAKISSLTGGSLTEADMTVKGMKINGYDVVPLTIQLRADAKQKQNRLTVSNGSKTFVRGNWRPSDGEYMVRGGVHGIPVGVAKPFLSDALVNPQGTLDIDFDITSQNKLPVITTGSVALHDFAAGISFNNVTYAIADAIIPVTNNVASLPATTITDSEGHTAKLTAKADFKNFSNIAYLANIQAENLFVLNTTFDQNPTFYGKLYVTGKVDMAGDSKGMNVAVTAETNSGSSFNLPITGNRSVVNSDFVKFESSRNPVVEAEDALTYPGGKTKPRKSDDTHKAANVNISMNLTVRPNTEVNIVVDPSNNDGGIRARGDAMLTLRIAPRSDIFALNGTYEISEGDYPLNIQGITRVFAIQNGGTIRWSGTPLDPQLDIQAVYSLRTTLSPLQGILGETFDPYMRVPVDCIINIDSKLTNPQIAPDIKVRLSDPQMEATIESAITAQDVKLTQFGWLLLFGEFFSGGNVTNENINLTDVGIATAAAAGSGVLTSELNKLINNEDGFSFNFDYRPRSESTSTEVVIGITKKLTNRITLQVNGDYTTNDNPAVASALNTRAGALIPDASLTLNLTNRLSGSLFYRPVEQHNNSNTFFNDIDKGTSEFGAGISYRIDFNSFKDLLNKIAGKKKTK